MNEGLSQIIQKIKAALFSKTNKEILIFCFFFCVSAFFWMLQALNVDREQVLTIPIDYESIPTDVIVTSNPPENIKVTVRDKGFNLLGYTFRNILKPILFDFQDYTGKGTAIKVTSSELQKQITDMLYGTTELLSFKPDNFEVVYTRGKAKKIPVLINANLVAKAQYEVTEYWTEPDSVLIYAPENVLDTITGIYTLPVSRRDLTDSISFPVNLESLQNVKVIPSKVNFLALVEQLTEKSLDVPVETINVPEGKVLRTFPTKVKVTFQTTLSYYHSVNANNIIVQVDYNDILANPNSSIKPTVLSPSILQHVRISPQVVDYLLENDTSPAEP